MLDHETRTAILRLHSEGHSARFIARTVGVSRGAAQAVLASGEAEVPEPTRRSVLDPWLEAIRELHGACAGNLVRVREELKARHGVEVPYATLTHFCRSAKIGAEPKKAAGHYHFEPGQEMQHDTSPHRVPIGGVTTSLQCASLVMCFSRRRFVQCYPRFNRFLAKVFLSDALRFLGGAAERCMLDNSTVLVTGTGSNAVAVPEMSAFAKRFDFTFVAHAVGHANRSARVERPFHHVENNFYPGRTFADLADLNAQLRQWCVTYNREHQRGLGFVPDERGILEQPALKPLPAWIPEPMEVHPRKVDVDGFVQLHTNLYSVHEDEIGQSVEVHETFRQVRIYLGHRLLAQHDKRPDQARERVLLPAHRRARTRVRPPAPSTEEQVLRAASPSLGPLCDALRARHGGQALRAVRRLHRMWQEYPSPVLDAVLTRAAAFDLHDLDRIETMVLRAIREDYFRLPTMENDHG